MSKYSRRDALTLGGIALAGMAGCTSQIREDGGQGDTIKDVIHEIEYRQTRRAQEFNRYTSAKILDPESLQLDHNPSNPENSDSDINYQLSLETHPEGPLSNFKKPGHIPNEVGDHPLSTIIGSMIFETVHVPVKGINGDAFVEEEACEDYRKRLGNLDVSGEDHEGHTTNVEVPNKKLHQFWDNVDAALEGTIEEKKSVSLEIREYVERKTEF